MILRRVGRYTFIPLYLFIGPQPFRRLSPSTMEVSMSTSSHYDLIIIDTGPDSGRLVCMLVPSEKKSLLLEPDGYPRARRTTKSTNKTSHPSASRFVSMIDLRQARTIPSNE